MRKAALLVLFALLVAATISAQNSGNANNGQSTTPQNQSGTTPGNTTPNQNTQSPTTTQSNVAPNSAPASVTGEVPAGTEIRATLDTPLSSKTSKAGDRFTATISQPVQGANGIVVPTGARVEGEVSEAEEGKTIPALRGKGTLNLRFRDIVLPNGQTVPLVATLISVNSTNGKNTRKADEEGQVESGTRGKDVAKDVGIGAGAGTLAGLVFGGPLKGMAIGAMAGGGYVLATNGKEVNLPAQTGMVIKLDQTLTIQ
jgi:cytoskeletal protein RodZ